MIEGDPGKSILLERLHQGLRIVSNEVAVTEAQVDYGSEITLSVGELSEMRMYQGRAELTRWALYFHEKFRAEYPVGREKLEEEISSIIARDRTEREKRSLAPDEPIVKDSYDLSLF